jgi:hypothetical protein
MTGRRIIITGAIIGAGIGTAIGLPLAHAIGPSGPEDGPAIYKLVDGTGPTTIVVRPGIGAEDDATLRLVAYSPERVAYRVAQH